MMALACRCLGGVVGTPFSSPQALNVVNLPRKVRSIKGVIKSVGVFRKPLA